MKYPSLVQKQFCTTSVHVTIESEELNQFGMPKYKIEAKLKCNYQETTKTMLTAEKKLVQINGMALFPGDIAPELQTLSGGTVVVNGVNRQIILGEKARNPDGTVNFCRLVLK